MNRGSVIGILASKTSALLIALLFWNISSACDGEIQANRYVLQSR